MYVCVGGGFQSSETARYDMMPHVVLASYVQRMVTNEFGLLQFVSPGSLPLIASDRRDRTAEWPVPADRCCEFFVVSCSPAHHVLTAFNHSQVCQR